MPRGIPTLGSSVSIPGQATQPMAASNSVIDELTNTPGAEVLGEIKAKQTSPNSWVSPDWNAVIQIEEGPPPWEAVEGPTSDARNFIECPDDWVLYWVNPRLLDAFGWRGWKPVMASDPRVKVLVPSMVSVANNIRRGGDRGDLLAYMPKHWYESRKKRQEEVTRGQTEKSVTQSQQLNEEFRRGRFGPHVSGEITRHPTHTMIHPDDLRGEKD